MVGGSVRYITRWALSYGLGSDNCILTHFFTMHLLLRRVHVRTTTPTTIVCQIRGWFGREKAAARACIPRTGRRFPLHDAGYFIFKARAVPSYYMLELPAWDPYNLCMILLRGTIVNRTYGTHKHLHIFLFLLTIFDPIYYGPPQYSGGP